MKEMINDWKPETKSLIKSLTKAGFTVTGGDNGEDRFKNDDKFLENLLACDEGHIYLTCPKGSKTVLFIVLGNSPGELVCDYGIPRDEDDAELLDTVTAAHYSKWEGRKQPKCESPH